MEVVVDANVWLSAANSREPGHADSVRFLREAMARRVAFLLPALVLPEVAGTAARYTQNPADGVAWIEQLRRLPNARFFDMTLTRALAAADLASSLRLRGADAQYAALAAEHRASLVTLDRELRERAGAQFESLSPAEWLVRYP
ncbi:MAG: PIN domain-containing protein [Lentisphaerae bacterium]|nr:PIN domain-containing protein [Lentisphaerota bacterium]